MVEEEKVDSRARKGEVTVEEEKSIQEQESLEEFKMVEDEDDNVQLQDLLRVPRVAVVGCGPSNLVSLIHFCIILIILS